jgi:hypothetical protein
VSLLFLGAIPLLLYYYHGKRPSVWPLTGIFDTRRKQGHEYLKQIIAPILDSVTNIVDLNLELNIVQIYQAMITDIEIQTGAKSTLNRDLPEEQIAENPEVKALLKTSIHILFRIEY